MSAVNPDVYALLVRYMIDSETFTYDDVAGITGLHRHSIFRYVQAFHDQKLIHLHDKLPDSSGRRTIKLWKWGSGRDIGPLRKTTAEYRRLRRRLQAEQVPSVFHLAEKLQQQERLAKNDMK